MKRTDLSADHDIKLDKNNTLRKDVARVDYMTSSTAYQEDYNEFMVQELKETDEGFLQGRAIATNIGVFPYLQADGTVIRELRLPKEVRSFDSMSTLKGKPVTNDHPAGVMVDPGNVKDLQVGSIGDDVRSDAMYISVALTVTDAGAIKDVQSGKQGLSCGYVCDLEMTSGNFLGMEFDAIQRNIRYNHLAIVDAGRAGDAARLKVEEVASAGIGVYVDSSTAPAPTSPGRQDNTPAPTESVEVVESGLTLDTDSLGISKPGIDINGKEYNL